MYSNIHWLFALKHLFTFNRLKAPADTSNAVGSKPRYQLRSCPIQDSVCGNVVILCLQSFEGTPASAALNSMSSKKYTNRHLAGRFLEEIIFVNFAIHSPIR